MSGPEPIGAILMRVLAGVPNAVPKETIAGLRKTHMTLYQARLDSGSSAVRPLETKELLEIWTGMGDKGWDELTLTEKGEITDALASMDDGEE